MSESAVLSPNIDQGTSLKNWHLFLVLVLANVLIAFLYQEHIMTKDIFYALFSDQVETNRIDKFFDVTQRISIWGYLLTPVVLLIKFSFVALLLQFPLTIKFIDIPFKRLFRIMMLAAIPLLIGTMARYLWLLSLPVEQITKSVLQVTPLSLSSLIDYTKYTESSITILNNFSIYEIVWCLMVYLGLSKTEKLKKYDAAMLVIGVWTFLLVFQWALMAYLTKIN